MKIAFMHFHLKTGGVTTVIGQQVKALKETCETVALSGLPMDAPFPCDVIPIPGIAYDNRALRRWTPEETAAAVIAAIGRHWDGGCDILHVHNPTLAKNSQYLNILKILKERGVRLFLQIHDFAEDGRPQVYFQDDYVPDCHYGVINSRDYHILLKSGLKPQGLHLISNMVTPLPTSEETHHLDASVLYPIRAIRRKNIGEAILLSEILIENKQLYITLPPNSPADFPAYESWQQFARQHSLNVVFEAGLKYDFPTLVAAADSLLTTSISEGFGFSFLEPWTAGKFLWGRDLTGITADFKKQGVDLDHLYPQLRVPLEWVGSNGFYESWSRAASDNLKAFPDLICDFDIPGAFEHLASDGTIDFALLNERFQQSVVLRVIEKRTNQKKLLELNPFLADCSKGSTDAARIESNRERITVCYSKETYRDTLTRLYDAVMADTPTQAIDKRALLNHFLNLKDFSLLKWGRYDS